MTQLPPANRRLPLFRPEAMQATQSQWLGSIQVTNPPSFGYMTAGAVALAAMLAAFAAWGEVTRKSVVQGVLLPAGGLINVSAPQAGTVAEILVREGDVVRAGQAIVRLVSERVTSAGDAGAVQAQAIAARRASLDSERRLVEQSMALRQDVAARRQQSLAAEERQLAAELEMHQLRMQLAQRTVARNQQLARDGFVSPSQVQQREEELLDLQLRERTARRTLQAVQRDLQATSAEIRALSNQAQTSLTQIDRALAALTQEAAETYGRQGVVVTAPLDGRITTVLLNKGQTAQSAQTLVSLVPTSHERGQDGASELQAHLFAPSRTSGFIRPGQMVWLRYDAFPYQKFGMARAEVIAISHSPIAATDAPMARPTNEPVFRITARLPAQHLVAYGRNMPLAAGMRLEADVQHESRRIWEWLLEPVMAVARPSSS
jgi:membrane fusion protein